MAAAQLGGPDIGLGRTGHPCQLTPVCGDLRDTGGM